MITFIDTVVLNFRFPVCLQLYAMLCGVSNKKTQCSDMFNVSLYKMITDLQEDSCAILISFKSVFAEIKTKSAKMTTLLKEMRIA